MRVSEDRGGFVLALVVFMLFAISVAAATGYTLVSSEFGLSRHSSDGAEALTVARAGLERYVAESLGTLADTSSYALGSGVATVTSRKLFEQDSLTHVYYIRSEGTVDDVLTPNTPARRVVGAYATYHMRPIPQHGAVMIGTNTIRVQNGGSIDAEDRDVAGDCPGGGASTLTGAIAGISVTGTSDIDGNPDSEIWSGGWSAIQDSIAIRWDILSDPDFPVEFENTWPNYGSLPSDSFPVVRYTGWMYASGTGRGVLIVDGVFDPTSSFRWYGIVLARDVDDYIEGHIDGLLIGGLGDANMYTTVEHRMDLHYHSCEVYGANESLSYLELMPNTIHETN
jgi:hypothetical protein